MPGKFGDGQWSKFWGATNHMLDSVLPGSNPLNFTPPLLVNCPLLFHVGPPPPLFFDLFPCLLSSILPTLTKLLYFPRCFKEEEIPEEIPQEIPQEIPEEILLQYQ